MVSASTESSLSYSSRRVPQLDGIRGIAILLVLFWHYVSSVINPQSSVLTALLQPITSLTWSGVDLFFVLSGFLIGGILLDNRNAANYFRVFYTRRVCRIFPLYSVWLFLFIALPLAFPNLLTDPPLKGLFHGPLPIWSYATFTQNIGMARTSEFGATWLGITWSLSIEEQFYLAVPLLIRVVSARKLPYVLLTLIFVTIMTRLLIICLPPHSSFSNYVLLPSRADALLLGVFCAFLVRERNVIHYLRTQTKILYAAFGVLFLGVLVLTAAAPSAAIFEFAMSSGGYTWLALFYSVFLLIAVTEIRGPFKSLTMNSQLRWLGGMAYGVYLIHQAINSLTFGLILGRQPELDGVPDLLVTLVSLVATLLVAGLSFHFFERSFTSWGQKLTYIARPSSSPPEVAYSGSNRLSAVQPFAPEADCAPSLGPETKADVSSVDREIIYP